MPKEDEIGSDVSYCVWCGEEQVWKSEEE